MLVECCLAKAKKVQSSHIHGWSSIFTPLRITSQCCTKKLQVVELSWRRMGIWRKGRRGLTVHTNWNRTSSLTDLSFSPFLSCRGTERIPGLNSETGRHVCPPKSSFSDMSYSRTSILSRASSGTVKGNSNSSPQWGPQSSSMILVLLLAQSAGAPTI